MISIPSFILNFAMPINDCVTVTRLTVDLRRKFFISAHPLADMFAQYGLFSLGACNAQEKSLLKLPVSVLVQMYAICVCVCVCACVYVCVCVYFMVV